MKEVLSNKLRNAKTKILEDIDANYNLQIDSLRKALEKASLEKETLEETPENEGSEAKTELIQLMDLRDHKLKTVQSSLKTMVKNYFKKIVRRDLEFYYQEIMQAEVLKRFTPEPLDSKLVEYISKNFLDLIKHKKIEFEDLTPLAYLQSKLSGFAEKLETSHVVIDEAQDLSLFQFYALRSILNTNQFTILGDIAQGIHSYRGITDWRDLIAQVFTGDDCEFLTLRQSYRTTVEIMDLANIVITKLGQSKVIPAEPVIRQGEKPGIRKFQDCQELFSVLRDKIEELRNQEFKTVAIIGKTMEECKKIKTALHKTKLQVEILSGEEDNYQGGVVIVPSYIVKGLEFDVVFIVNLEEEYSHTELDIKLLYVSMTRALHRLYFYYQSSCPLLD